MLQQIRQEAHGKRMARQCLLKSTLAPILTFMMDISRRPDKAEQPLFVSSAQMVNLNDFVFSSVEVLLERAQGHERKRAIRSGAFLNCLVSEYSEAGARVRLLEALRNDQMVVVDLGIPVTLDIYRVHGIVDEKLTDTARELAKKAGVEYLTLCEYPIED
jgi:hypothetical protein